MPEGESDPSGREYVPLPSEQFGLSMYASTQADRDVTKTWSVGLRMMGVGAFLFLVAIVSLGSASRNDFARDLTWTLLMVCVAAAGAVVMWRNRSEKEPRTLWYADGLVHVTPGGPEPEVLRWDEVVSVSVHISRPDHAPAFVESATPRDKAGTCMTVRGKSVAESCLALLSPMMLPALLRAFDAGETVSFGDMRVDRSGVTKGRGIKLREPRAVAWTDMRSVDIDARQDITVRPFGDGEDLMFHLDGVPNAWFAHLVIERGAWRAGVPVEYAEEGLMPPRPRGDVT